jgi:polyisoprenoid-binding protein YceI
MLKKALFTLFLFGSIASNAQLFSSTSSKVTFDSKTPMEDIHAETLKAKAAINVDTKKIMIKIKMISFKFAKPLMEEHFNEKYVETEKYPDASFTGNIVENVNLKVDGIYKVTVRGTLNIHGVDQARTIAGTITVRGGKIDMNTDFTVKLVDHKITVPSVVNNKIAEVINVSAYFSCSPVEKK